MDELQRSVDELMLLYELEPETRDIFVEGISDKLIFDRFFEKNKLLDVKVIEVKQINFSSIYKEYPHIKSNNKAKLVALNKMLEDNFEDILAGISIIIDRDFDEILGTMVAGDYIYYTDYNSLELYLFNPHTLDIFYKNVLHSFPLNGAQTIERLSPVLVDSFLTRIVVNKDGLIPNAKFTPLQKSISINKATLEISFSAQVHIQKVLNNTQKMARLSEFKNYFDELKSKLKSESKMSIKGHDFMAVFFHFIDKIQNNIGLTADALERVLFQCIDFSKLRYEPLFKLLISKYS